MTRYQDSLRWLYGLESRGIKLGLERVEEASEARGNPHHGLAYVHIAGSNGKGSVAAMLESVFREAGYRTGQFASPHLHRYVERVRIDGRPISESEAAMRIEELRKDPRLPKLTFFEYTTLLAFESFRSASCDLVMLEVGLGGRLDATNIITPRLSMITNISLEHQRILGDTRAKIAAEKAGILKPGVPCVVGARGGDVRRTIRSRARRVGAPLCWVGNDFEGRWNGSRLDVRVGDDRHEGLRLGLRGRHQAENAACVVAAVHALEGRGFPVSSDALRRGLLRAKWPGRLEWCPGKPAFLFDAAHNAAGCERLGEHLQEMKIDRKVVLLFGASKDKDHRKMLAAFDSLVDRRVYVTPNVRRAERAERLASIRPATIARSVRDGVSRARRAAGNGGLVVVAGSIFLVSEARALVKGVRTDPPIQM